MLLVFDFSAVWSVSVTYIHWVVLDCTMFSVTVASYESCERLMKNHCFFFLGYLLILVLLFFPSKRENNPE